MRSIMMRLSSCLALALFWVEPSYALDSYRFFHVTIDTPWSIFIFLLGTIFVPFILMAVLVWRYAEKRASSRKEDEAQPEEKR